MATLKLCYGGDWAHRKDEKPCAHGCVGPFVRRVDQDEWLTRLMDEAGLPDAPILPQYDCATCGTTRGLTPRELKGAA